MTPCACTRSCACPALQRLVAEAERLCAAVRAAPWGSAERVQRIREYDEVIERMTEHRREAGRGRER